MPKQKTKKASHAGIKHRLALALGWSMRRLNKEINSRELSEWLAYSQIEPFGDSVIHNLLANLCCIVFNAHRGKQKALNVKDLLPWRTDLQDSQMDENTIKATFRNAFIGINAALRQRKK